MPMLPWFIAAAGVLQAGQTPAPAVPKTATVDVRVTDRGGMLLGSAHVTAEGPLSREGATDASGAVTFKNVPAGTYRFRIEHDGFFTLEKDVTVRAGMASSVDAALTAAPPPPAPPAPEPVAPVTPPAPVLVAGDPTVVDIPDLADRADRLGTSASKESALGCSGATAARLVQARDVITSHARADADETLYLVGGEGSLHMADKDYPLTAGAFVLVPRGTEYTLTRKGKNPVIVLSTVNGPVCPKK